jgi:hypothetical protein
VFSLGFIEKVREESERFISEGEAAQDGFKVTLSGEFPTLAIASSFAEVELAFMEE